MSCLATSAINMEAWNLSAAFGGVLENSADTRPFSPTPHPQPCQEEACLCPRSPQHQGIHLGCLSILVSACVFSVSQVLGP